MRRESLRKNREPALGRVEAIQKARNLRRKRTSESLKERLKKRRRSKHLPFFRASEKECTGNDVVVDSSNNQN